MSGKDGQEKRLAKSAVSRFAAPRPVADRSAFLPFCLLLLAAFLVSACNQIKTPKPEPFIGEVAPPRKQEFRWSNGKTPKSLDPARAAAAPEIDIVRALYEGLTDTDPKTLQPVPAVAARWESSEDHKTWTFHLRPDAKWSNGEPVTAPDFVRSWQRLVKMGEAVAQRDLLQNIVGMDTKNVLPVFASDEAAPADAPENENKTPSAEKSPDEKVKTPAPGAANKPNAEPADLAKPKEANSREAKPEDASAPPPTENPPAAEPEFGVEAVDAATLVVTLKAPDRTFPQLVAHPMFRPVYGDAEGAEGAQIQPDPVTNGAFRLASVAPEGIVLERDRNFWDTDKVQLERVKFVPAENAETALAAYQAGEIDAITNANFEPLAVKLLAPYDDFRRSVHGALNFYEFNRRRKPFDDRRVREALAISVERERITKDEMEGATEPAHDFLPFSEGVKIVENAERGRSLLADAGFPDGANFPTVRLLVNRNDAQRRIARAVAKMWKKNLNVETEIVVKDAADFESSAKNGDFDVIRRGVVLPTADETINMMAILSSGQNLPSPEHATENLQPKDKPVVPTPDASALAGGAKKDDTADAAPEKNEILIDTVAEQEIFFTEAEALRELPAMPLYFPTSYSLIKPYVLGFDTNFLDAPSLKDVKIDSGWQPPNPKNVSNGKS